MAQFLSTSQASQYLSLAPTSLRRFADHGDIPFTRTVKGFRQFTLDDLRKFQSQGVTLTITGKTNGTYRTNNLWTGMLVAFGFFLGLISSQVIIPRVTRWYQTAAQQIITRVFATNEAVTATYFHQPSDLTGFLQTLDNSSSDQIGASQMIIWAEETPRTYLSGKRGPITTLFVIDQPELLKRYPFFANAKAGDRLMIWANYRKTLLYRPSTNEVIAFGWFEDTISTKSPAGPQAGALIPLPVTKQLGVVIRDGASMPGPAISFEALFNSLYPNALILSVTDATRKNYNKTILIDPTGTRSVEARAMAAKLGITVAPLPVEEAAIPPGVDFLIVVGGDRK